MKQTNPTNYLQLNGSSQNQCDKREARDGKVGCNTGKYKTLKIFLYSDWL